MKKVSCDKCGKSIPENEEWNIWIYSITGKQMHSESKDYCTGCIDKIKKAIESVR
jgi:ribosomal protein S26